jgi:hypothetical protein
LYASVVIPALRIIVTPLETDTRKERVESLRILAAANTLIIICLVAVLFMQVCAQLVSQALVGAVINGCLVGRTGVRKTLRGPRDAQVARARTQTGC